MSEEAMLTMMAENRKLRAEIGSLAAAIPLAEKNGEQRERERQERERVPIMQSILDEQYERGRLAEREAVVRWLRKEFCYRDYPDDDWHNNYAYINVEVIAKAIAHGEHREGE